MASKCSNAVTTFYQCSECNHCSQSLEEATLHAVQAHQECKDDDIETDDEFKKDLILSDEDDYENEIDLGSSNGAGSSGIGNHWSPEATKDLINAVKVFYHELSSNSRKFKLIWEDISDVIKIHGVTACQCEKQWRQIVSNYKNFLVSKNKNNIQKLDYIELMASIVGDDILKGNDVDFESDNYRNTRNRNTKGHEAENLTSALKSLLNGEDRSTDASTLVKLIHVLEKRESSNLSFQKRVIEIEKEKLDCMQRFVENKEKQSIRRYVLMKEYIYNQIKTKKRKIDQE